MANMEDRESLPDCASVSEVEVASMDDGPITITIDLAPCSLDAEERYAIEFSIIRYLAWLVVYAFTYIPKSGVPSSRYLLCSSLFSYG